MWHRSTRKSLRRSDAATIAPTMHSSDAFNYNDTHLRRWIGEQVRAGSPAERYEREHLVKQCSLEYQSWTVEKKLSVMELWHHIHGMNQIQFMSMAINELLGRIIDLSDDHALQIAYYVSQPHLQLPGIHTTNLQEQSLQRVNKMSLEVMSILRLAFFTNETPITNKKLLDGIYSKLR